MEAPTTRGDRGLCAEDERHPGRHEVQKQKMPANEKTDDRIRTYQINSSFFRTWARASCASARWVSCNERREMRRGYIAQREQADRCSSYLKAARLEAVVRRDSYARIADGNAGRTP